MHYECHNPEGESCFEHNHHECYDQDWRDNHPCEPDICASDCDDQLPIISGVGRGIQGDTYRVDIADPDTTDETHLEGLRKDEATQEWHSEWVSENINGGELKYQYNLRPYTIPRTFTITFMYRRPGRPEWSWTTPAIPYIWTLDPAGKPDTDPDHVVGSGVATLFCRTVHDRTWDIARDERLWYPEGTTRDDFNAPLPEEGWSATVVFGHGGDIDVPDFDDIAKIIGIPKEDIYNILEDHSIHIDGIDATDIVDYINKCDRRDRDHFHKDLGFNSEGHAASGAFGSSPITGKSYNTVKQYIDEGDQAMRNAIQAIINKVYGGGTLNPDGSISWGNDKKIPTGNLNVFGGSSKENWIRTRDGEQTNDIWGK